MKNLCADTEPQYCRLRAVKSFLHCFANMYMKNKCGPDASPHLPL